MLDKILDFIWPRTCAVCRREVDRPARHVCSDCLMRLPFVPRDGLCRRCGRDAAGLDGEFLCEDCRTHHPHFDRAASVFRFTGDARELVNAFKFRERLELRDDLVDFLEGMVRAHFKIGEIDCVVPIPATLGHRWIRGYNQCAVLARPLAKRLGKPYRTLLKRVGHPGRQGGLGEEERRTNVVGTFRFVDEASRLVMKRKTSSLCEEARRLLYGKRKTTSLCEEARRLLYGKRKTSSLCEEARRLLYGKMTVLVVDDIMTTGSTLSEAAKTLKEAGIGRVWTIALARSVRD